MLAISAIDMTDCTCQYNVITKQQLDLPIGRKPIACIMVVHISPARPPSTIPCEMEKTPNSHTEVAMGIEGEGGHGPEAAHEDLLLAHPLHLELVESCGGSSIRRMFLCFRESLREANLLLRQLVDADASGLPLREFELIVRLGLGGGGRHVGRTRQRWICLWLFLWGEVVGVL
jgi:hypothetical protein